LPRLTPSHGQLLTTREIGMQFLSPSAATEPPPTEN
jgi:hypothetical protein